MGTHYSGSLFFRKMLRRMLEGGNFDRVMGVVNDNNVKTHTISSMILDEKKSKTRLICQFLRIKKSKGRTKMVTKDNGSKMMRLEEPYDRLTLCR